MNVLDVNVLLALYRADHAHHDVCSRWWADSLRRGEAFTVPDVVWVGFLRIVTHARAFAVPSTFADAWTFVEAVGRQGTHVRYMGDPRLLAELGRLCHENGVRANLVSDAYIAAVASIYGANVVTLDRDFRKFDGIRVVEPA